MIDISETTNAKSDQLNSIDLIGGPIQIKITGVNVVSGDQPVHIQYEGCQARVWKPCKSMRRILMLAWGKNGEDYIGRSLVLFNDPAVKWAGSEQGGIRISHMTDIKDNIRTMLTVSRGRKAPFVAHRLDLFTGNPLSADDLDKWSNLIDGAADMNDLNKVNSGVKEAQYDEQGKNAIRPLYTAAVEKIRSNEPATV